MGQKPVRSIDVMFMVILILVPVMSIPWHEGIGICNQASYAYAAKKLAQGLSLDYNDLYETRIAAWLPYSIAIKISGGMLYITWISTIEFMLVLSSIYLLLRKHEQIVGFYATALLAFSTLMLEASGSILGDLMFTLLINMPLLVYWRCVKKETEWNVKLWGIIAGVCWIAAFYAKESAIYYLPISCFFAWSAWRNSFKRDVRFWKWFGITLCIGGLLTAACFYLKTGDPFRKITLAQENVTYYDLASSQRIWHTPAEMLYRYTFQPLVFLVQDYSFGILLIFSILYLIPQGKREDGFWRWYFLGTLVMWWAFPQRMHPWHPMWLTYRLWMPLIVPLAICAAYGMKILITGKESSRDQKRAILVALSFAIISYVSYPSFHLAIFYGMVAIFMVMGFWIKENEVLPNLRKIILIIAIIPFLGNVHERLRWMNTSPSESEYATEVLRILEERGAHRVLTDYCLKEFYKLYDDKKLTVIFYDAHNMPGNLSNTYLVTDKLLLQDVSQLPGDDDFKEIGGTKLYIEEHPLTMGFKVVQETGRYTIYYHQ